VVKSRAKHIKGYVGKSRAKHMGYVGKSRAKHMGYVVKSSII
jgi:hypothetical protein